MSKIAKSNDANFKIIYLETPLHVIRMRMKDNDKKKLRHSVDDLIFEKSIKKFISPSPEEGHDILVFKENDDISMWLDKNFIK